MHGESVVLALHIHHGTVCHQGDVGPDDVKRKVFGDQHPTVLGLEDNRDNSSAISVV